MNSNSESLEIFKRKSMKFHGNDYDYFPSSDYNGMRQKVSIKCNKCNFVFRQRAYSHVKGQGCPVCANNQTLSTEKFVEKSKKIHGDKYDYSETIYSKTSGKVKIKCLKCDSTFLQRANDHLNGSGCSFCNKREGQSFKKLSTEIFVTRSMNEQLHLKEFEYVRPVGLQSYR